MQYIKNGKIRESNLPLERENHSLVFNAPHEMWLEEGWQIYDPFPAGPVAEEVSEPTFEDLQNELIEDAKGFAESLKMPIPKEERTSLRQLAEDLLEEGMYEADIFDNDTYVDLAKFIAYCKNLNKVEYRRKEVLKDHIHEINLLETERELDRYDYTTGYPVLPEQDY